MTALPLSVPKTWDEVTPEWMSQALSDRHPGVSVKDIDVVSRDDGTNRRARLGLPMPRVLDPTPCSSRRPIPRTRT